MSLTVPFQRLRSAIAVACISAAIAGCKSSMKTAEVQPEARTAVDNVPPDTPDADLDAAGPQFAVTPIQGRRFSLSFAVGASTREGLAAVRRIEAFSAVIYDPTGGRVDSISTNEINRSGTMNAETSQTSIACYGGLEWEAQREPPPGMYAVLRLHTTKGVSLRSLPFGARQETFHTPRQAPEQAIDLTLDALTGTSGVTFTLTARRVAPTPKGEYLPTTEQFRIDIINQVGQKVWSTNDGMNYGQMIGTVLPADVGQSTKHTATWNGVDRNTGTVAAPGTYRAVAMIPSKPIPYTTLKEFPWRGTK